MLHKWLEQVLGDAFFGDLDVLLLDLGLPRLSGYDVAERLKGLKVPKRPLIIAITGFGQEADRLRSAEVGIDLHLVKPADPERLLAMLHRFRNIIVH